MLDTNNITISPEEYAQLEDYLDAKLQGEELRAFESRLGQDESWVFKLEQVKFLREGIEASAMKSQMDIFHKEMNLSNVPTRAIHKVWPWAAAACFLLVLAAGAWLAGLFTSDSERLFQAYYEKDSGLIAVMSKSENYEFERGMVDYKSDDYSGALGFWLPLLESNPQNDTLQYFVSLSYLEKKDFAEGKLLLQHVINDPSSEFQKDAAWYFGLTMVKQGEFQEAIPYLKLSERKEAEELIQKIYKLE